ncbi:MAG: hypothetical protein CMO01_32300 [Thalassobius sp.]|nr:hypothetical protein [Thalassovita sp.]|tara:strand:+ start:239 stop:418 length:180 start_codon:yes stop_codon:yes gene_type:complete
MKTLSNPKSYRTNLAETDMRFYNQKLPDLSVIPFHHQPGIYKVTDKSEPLTISQTKKAY